MVLAKHLARLLNGIDGAFEVEGVIGVDVNYKTKTIRFQTQVESLIEDINVFKPWDGEAERFFPNMVGIDDDNQDYRTNTTPAVESGQKQSDRFVPATNGLEVSDDGFRLGNKKPDFPSRDRFAPGRGTLYDSEEQFDREYEQWQAEHPDLPKERFRPWIIRDNSESENNRFLPKCSGD